MQVRMKVWEARSLVRLTWPSSLAPLRPSHVEGAQLVLASGATLTFALGDEARATSVGAHQKAFEFTLGGLSHLEPPLAIGCHYQLKGCNGASWQLIEEWGSGYRAEV